MSSTSRVPSRPEPEPRRERRALIDDLHAAALDAITDGFAVFPLRPYAKTPAIKRWELRATRDRDIVDRWWRNRPCNIGIATGPSHLVVVDLDIAGPDEVAPEPWTGLRTGHEVLQRIATQAGHPVPATRTVITPSGGRHLYFRAAEGSTLRNTAGQLGWHIDTRAAGGYVVAPGSALPTGRYELARGGTAVELPNWLTTTLQPPPPYYDDVAPVAVRDRSAYVTAVVEAECQDVMVAQVGQRHDTLFRAACHLGRLVGGGALDQLDARAALTTAAGHYVGVEGYTADKVNRDITDGLAYGTRRPRHLDHHKTSNGSRRHGARRGERRPRPGTDSSTSPTRTTGELDRGEPT